MATRRVGLVVLAIAVGFQCGTILATAESTQPAASDKAEADHRSAPRDGEEAFERGSADGPAGNREAPEAEQRFATLEDIYGDAGNSFQAALGFLVIEGSSSPPQSGFGAAVDDMVVSWREFRLDADQTDCDPASGGGSCAAIEIATTNVFVGSGVINVRLIETSPYDPVNERNDCDQNGSFSDTGTCTLGGTCSGEEDCVGADNFCVGADDQDCNDNGVHDIVAMATSESLDQEILVLDLADAVGVYEVDFPISATYDVDGVLFLSASGTDAPSVEVRYLDRDDGTGHPCPNDANAAVAGVIKATTSALITRGTVVVKVDALSDNGDGDGIPDTHEIVNLQVRAYNKTGVDLDAVVVRLGSSDPDVECIINPAIGLGTILAGQNKGSGDLVPPQAFVFKIADVNRTDIYEDLSATFDVTLTSDKFDALSRQQTIVLPLDLDLSGGGSPTTELFDFETSNLSNAGFEADEIDLDHGGSLGASNGFRCQYNDPDDWRSQSYQRADCFLGFAVSQNNALDWHIHKAQDPDGGRAFENNRSLHWGFHKSGDPAQDTTRLKSLEAVVTKDPVNLGTGPDTSELIFWHQISLMDYRGSTSPFGESVDRAVVHLQLYDGAQGIGNWIKIAPFENVYDVQGTDQFSNCMFDPTDDGNDEDSLFDPSDPTELSGPSSTCFPEFVFGSQGDTDYRSPFRETNTGRASDTRGPGDSDPTVAAGNVGNGTWVRTSFDLTGFLGRQILLRFLATSIEVATSTDYIAAGFDPDIDVDDGWYIDAVQITHTLTSPATASVDTKTPPTEGCGALCDNLQASLVTDPPASQADPLPTPGQVLELDASGSSADRCVDGVLQYRFWRDGECLSGGGCSSPADGTFGNAGDAMLRDFTDDAHYVDAPAVDTAYGVVVRCSSDPSCTSTLDGVGVTVDAFVDCPSDGFVTGATAFPLQVVFTDGATLSWNAVTTVDIVRGDLGTLRATGGAVPGFTGSLSPSPDGCQAENGVIGAIGDPDTPAVGSGYYYLVRPEEGLFCNEDAGSYGTGTAAERDGRDSEINADGNGCTAPPPS